MQCQCIVEMLSWIMRTALRLRSGRPLHMCAHMTADSVCCGCILRLTQQVTSMILKKNLKQEPENQIVEDALCLGMYAWHAAHLVERC